MSLEEEVGGSLRSRGLTLALAESCTGGLVASLLTDIPGSSDYFMASFVTYSNESKVSALNVSPGTLAVHGAVSEEVAREMARGAREAGMADIGVAITGIAGPGGGSAEKPVGLVIFALDDGSIVKVDRRVFPGDRLAVKSAAARRALSMLREHLEGSGAV